MHERQRAACDVLVVGSGAGGMAAAVAAAKLGLDVIVIEKEPVLGGTTATSGGWLWIPCNPLAQRAGIRDSLDNVREYLRHELGDRYEEARLSAYLERGPEAVAFFERETEVRFFLGRDYPDYHPGAPGALPGGRAICAEPFDGRVLGRTLAHIRMPPREMTLFGIKVGSGPDYRHFANASRSAASARYVARRICVHYLQRMVYGRDTTLMSGGALIGRLVKSALDLNVRLWRSTPATELVSESGRVAGVLASGADGPLRISARRGVVLAAGGFPHDSARRRRLFPEPSDNAASYSVAWHGDTGDGVNMAEQLGAAVESSYANPAAWMPVSRVSYRDGAIGLFPHTFDRGKPGVIAVTANGKRFVNEANSYHDVGEAMLRTRPAGAKPCAFLVCDHVAIRRYGLGMAKPFPFPLGPYLRSGYLKCAQTIEALAAQAGIDPQGLSETIRRYNGPAREGRDPEFGKGGNAYNRYQGDPFIAPNPCVAPIVAPPFYAVTIHLGDLGTFAGLRTDEHARVLSAAGEPISGLYAAGTDMASIFGGCYPGPGINLGPAMTFGYIAALHLAQTNERRPSQRATTP